MNIGKANTGFQSTLPVWGATAETGETQAEMEISIHAPRVGSDGAQFVSLHGVRISIHAPRVGSDAGFSAASAGLLYFNPRSPCGERRPRHCQHRKGVRHFNPRSPCGERRSYSRRAFSSSHFNPRSPCGERRLVYAAEGEDYDISIHAPRVGSDVGPFFGLRPKIISIHAPRVGSD